MPNEFEELADEVVEDEELVLKPDFEEATDFEPVPAGEYPVKVVDVDFNVWPRGTDAEHPVKPNGEAAYPMTVFHLEIVEMPGFEHRRLVPFRAAQSGPWSGFLLSTLKALVPGYVKGAPIRKSDLIGKLGTAIVRERMYEGEKTNDVRRIVRYRGSVNEGL